MTNNAIPNKLYYTAVIKLLFMAEEGPGNHAELYQRCHNGLKNQTSADPELDNAFRNYVGFRLLRSKSTIRTVGKAGIIELDIQIDQARKLLDEAIEKYAK